MNAIDSKIRPTTKHDPCLLCGDTSGDCRANGDLILCHTLIDKTETNTHTWIKYSKDSVWGVYVPRQDEKSKVERDRYLLQKQAEKQERLEREARKFSQGLTRQERDAAIRKLSQVGLIEKHREQLRQRGLSDAAIAQGLFFSVYPDMEIPLGVNEKLPGVDRGKLVTKKTGFACVAFDHSGLAIGFQIRDENSEANAKYTWAKGTFSSHLQTGELPLSVAGIASDAVVFCEGILKPRVASCRYEQLKFLGASGGNFAGSPLQLKAALGKDRRIIICPDAGDIQNPHVMRRWKRTRELFNHNYRVEVAWWGQVDKTHPDIDERDGWDGVTFMNFEEWEMLADDYN